MARTVVGGSRARSGAPGRLLRRLARLVNPLVPIAASGTVPLWAVLRHRGRRSGRTYATPVAIRPTGEGFVIPLPFGENADWCRNVLAAGRAEIRWKNADYTVVEPQVVDSAAALPAFAPPLRFLIRALRISRFLRVRAV